MGLREHVRANLDGGVPCPVDLDAISAYRSLERIRAISTAHQADMWIMHDPTDWEKWGAPGQAFT